MNFSNLDQLNNNSFIEINNYMYIVWPDCKALLSLSEVCTTDSSNVGIS